MNYKILISVSILMFFLFSYSEKGINNVKTNTKNTDSLSVFLKGYKYEKADGTMFSFNQVKGKVLLLDFWATWCGPCIKEHPDVVALEKNINNSNFQIITISIDKNKSKWQDFISKNKWASINIKMDPNDSDNPLNKMVSEKVIHNGKAMFKTSVPRYYLIDKKLFVKEIEDIKLENTIILIKKYLE